MSYPDARVVVDREDRDMDEYEYLEQMALERYLEELDGLLAPAWSMDLPWDKQPTLGDWLGE